MSPQALVARAMDAYLLDNDLRSASLHAGDEIASVMRAYIEEVVEEGELEDVQAIVDLANERAEAEIAEILEQDRIEQSELADEDDEEVCDA